MFLFEEKGLIYFYEVRVPLALCLLVPSVVHLCKQFGSRSGTTKCRARSGSKLFDTLMVFPKELFEKVDFEKNQQTTKKHGMQNYPECKELGYYVM